MVDPPGRRAREHAGGHRPHPVVDGRQHAGGVGQGHQPRLPHRLAGVAEDRSVAFDRGPPVEGGHPVPETGIDEGFGCVQDGHRVTAVVGIAELAPHQFAEDPATAVGGQDPDQRHSGGRDLSAGDGQPEGYVGGGSDDGGPVQRAQGSVQVEQVPPVSDTFGAGLEPIRRRPGTPVCLVLLGPGWTNFEPGYWATTRSLPVRLAISRFSSARLKNEKALSSSGRYCVTPALTVKYCDGTPYRSSAKGLFRISESTRSATLRAVSRSPSGTMMQNSSP